MPLPECEDDYLELPPNEPWPITGRDAQSGDCFLKGSFVKALEKHNGLASGSLDQNRLGDLLLTWYIDCRQRGEDSCPVMEQILAEREAARKYGWVRVQKGSGLKN